jgi:hypothetical protein
VLPFVRQKELPLVAFLPTKKSALSKAFHFIWAKIRHIGIIRKEV